MALSKHRGFTLQSLASDPNIWQVQIKKHVLRGTLPAVKKSIDWFCDASQIIDPREFSSLEGSKQANSGSPASEVFSGHQLKNDTGEPNAWYCMFNGRLLKGGKLAIQNHIEAYNKALAAAKQAKK